MTRSAPPMVSPATTRETVLARCTALAGAELTFPFGDETAVFKVGGKMLALVSLDDTPGRVTLKSGRPLGAEPTRIPGESWEEAA